MRSFLTKRNVLALAILVGLISITGTNVLAQKKKPEYVQAVAMGTSTQMGRVINVDLIMSEFSTDADKAALLEAFQGHGSNGLVNALDKMSAKGRIRVTGTLGYDVNYLRSFQMPDGTRLIRFVTDRPITFGEAWGASRSRDYEITMGEIVISKEKGKSTGKLYPAAMVKLNKENELEIETYKNPWNLVNIRLTK